MLYFSKKFGVYDMRIKPAIIFIMIVFLFAAACGSQIISNSEVAGYAFEADSTPTIEPMDYLSTIFIDYWKIIDNGRNFRIVQLYEYPSWYHRYELLNNNGETVFYFTTSRPAWIEHVNDDVLQLSVSAGTNVIWSKYYSAESDTLSDVFYNVELLEGENIAYISRDDDYRHMIVVRNIFDKEIFHREFFFDEFAPGTLVTSSTTMVYLGDSQLYIDFLEYGGVFDKSIILCINGKWGQALIGADFVQNRFVGDTLREYVRLVNNGRAYELFSTFEPFDSHAPGYETWLFISEYIDGTYFYIDSFKISMRQGNAVQGVVLADVDFDGTYDVLVWLGHFGAQGLLRYEAFLSRGDSYVRSNFAEISNPQIDMENRLIRGSNRGSAGSHSFSIYEFIDGYFVWTNELVRDVCTEMLRLRYRVNGHIYWADSDMSQIEAIVCAENSIWGFNSDRWQWIFDLHQ